ncbi:hypothetical protein ACWFRJ_43405 [Streptomyces sp. NPDC055239]
MPARRLMADGAVAQWVNGKQRAQLEAGAPYLENPKGCAVLTAHAHRAGPASPCPSLIRRTTVPPTALAA